MPRQISVLLVEDNPGDIRLIEDAFRSSSLVGVSAVASVQTLDDAVKVVRNRRPDVILLDLGLPDSSGLDTLVSLRATAPRTAIVVLTTQDDTLALRALQAGAQDFLTKGHIDADLLARSIRYAAERQALVDRLDGEHHRTRRQRERLLLEVLGGDRDTGVLRRFDRPRPLRERAPTSFRGLAARLAEAVTNWENRTLDLTAGGELRSIAEHLGALHASARDLVDLEEEAVRQHSPAAPIAERTQVEEAARSALLHMMGLVLNYYRTASQALDDLSEERHIS